MPVYLALMTVKFTSASAWAARALASFHSAAAICGSIGGDDSLNGQLLGLLVLDLRDHGFGLFGFHPTLVDGRQDLEELVTFLHQLALFQLDPLQIPFLQGADFDAPPRTDLTDVLLGNDDILHHGVGDHDLLMGLVVGVYVVRLAGWEGEDGQRQGGNRDQ